MKCCTTNQFHIRRIHVIKLCNYIHKLKKNKLNVNSYYITSTKSGNEKKKTIFGNIDNLIKISLLSMLMLIIRDYIYFQYVCITFVKRQYYTEQNESKRKSIKKSRKSDIFWHCHLYFSFIIKELLLRVLCSGIQRHLSKPQKRQSG